MVNLRSILTAFFFLPLLAIQAETGANIIKTSGVLAGFPDMAKKRDGVLAFDNADEVKAAYAGEKGGLIGFVRTEDGTQTGEIKLDSHPVFDGVSAVHGKIFVALMDGRVICLK